MDPISYVWGISCICLGCIRKQVTLDLSVLLWGTRQGRADGPMYWQLHGTLTIRLSVTCGFGGNVLCNWLTQTGQLPWAEPTHYHSSVEAVVLALYTSQAPKRPPVRIGHMSTSATSAAWVLHVLYALVEPSRGGIHELNSPFLSRGLAHISLAWVSVPLPQLIAVMEFKVIQAEN